jgi:hypothetical protein
VSRRHGFNDVCLPRREATARLTLIAPSIVAFALRRPPFPGASAPLVARCRRRQGAYRLPSEPTIFRDVLIRVVATCERLSEAYLVPVIKAMLEGFPFTISGFHVDNGDCFNPSTADPSACLMPQLPLRSGSNLYWNRLRSVTVCEAPCYERIGGCRDT